MIGMMPTAASEAMNWELGFTEGEFIPHLNMNSRLYYMTNDAGVTIHWWGQNGKARSWEFRYIGKDIRFEFSARVPPGTPWRGEWDDSIGPVCDVLIYSDKLSRPVSVAEGKEIADTVVSFLLEHRRIPRAVPPFPERVTFSDIAKRALKIQD